MTAINYLRNSATAICSIIVGLMSVTPLNYCANFGTITSSVPQKLTPYLQTVPEKLTQAFVPLQQSPKHACSHVSPLPSIPLSHTTESRHYAAKRLLRVPCSWDEIPTSGSGLVVETAISDPWYLIFCVKELGEEALMVSAS